MDSTGNYFFKHSGKKSYIQIRGELSPKKVYDIYSFLNGSSFNHCQHLTIDLKEVDNYTISGAFLLASVVRELKKTITSVRVFGISSGQEDHFKNLGMTDVIDYNLPYCFEGAISLMEV